MLAVYAELALKAKELHSKPSRCVKDFEYASNRSCVWLDCYLGRALSGYTAPLVF